jgi:trehalose utilization protein
MKIARHVLILFVLLGFTHLIAGEQVRVLVWDEQQPQQKEAYGSQFLGETVAAHLNAKPGLFVKSVRLDDPEQGLGEDTLDATDVLVLWCHRRVRDQDDARMESVVQRVISGRLALIALHSAHWSKPFVRLMQERSKADAFARVPEAERKTSQWLFLNDKPYYKGVKFDAPLTPSLERVEGVWQLTLPQCVFPAFRADGQPSHVKTLLLQHPIAAGLPDRWDIPQTEMYGEPFHVPDPDEVVFEETWDKGERFRSGMVWKVGSGRVFYFRPGHETYPIFKQTEPLRVIENAARWLAPSNMLQHSR